MKQVTAVILAAGKGLRFKTKISKPLVKINSKPIVIYSLNTFSKHPYIKDIVLVVNKLNRKEIIKKIRQYRIRKIRQVVIGGRRRQDSVMNGLKAIDSRSDLVLIHDAVRPFIDKATISSVIKEAQKSTAAVVGVPVKSTIKSVKASKRQSVKVKCIVEKTLDRTKLWEIQTPQVFKKDLILEAYRKCANLDVTDDAMLAEKLGAKVKIVPGSYKNIKITTPEDLVIAEAILKSGLRL